MNPKCSCIFRDNSSCIILQYLNGNFSKTVMKLQDEVMGIHPFHLSLHFYWMITVRSDISSNLSLVQLMRINRYIAYAVS
jgi:hypothetical protein